MPKRTLASLQRVLQASMRQWAALLVLAWTGPSYAGSFSLSWAYSLPDSVLGLWTLMGLVASRPSYLKTDSFLFHLNTEGMGIPTLLLLAENSDTLKKKRMTPGGCPFLTGRSK